MTSVVFLDAGAVSRCRRRVHLEHDPQMREALRAAPDPTAEQRMADAASHRRTVADELATMHGSDWVEIPTSSDVPILEREQATLAALAAGARFVWAPSLPRDQEGGRRGGGPNLLVRVNDGYLPVLVARHKVSDPGEGARTSSLQRMEPIDCVDPTRRVRPQPRDQLRLAHAIRLLQSAGHAATEVELGGVIGLEADVVLWHDLAAQTWPGGRSALDEYDARFADRLAIATAAATGSAPLAVPSRIVECRSCPWWPHCESRLLTNRDVSLVVRGEDAFTLRAAGVPTVDELAAIDLDSPPELPLVGLPLGDAIGLARAWLADYTVVRRTESVSVPRAEVEVDVDMESFGDAGAYMWGVLLSGADIGVAPGYRSFVTWEPLPDDDEARSFAEFWAWLTDVRARAAARGLSFRAYCYNELAENRWLLASARRFAGKPGVPTREQVEEFIGSDAWFDLFASVRDHFLCAHGKGLKTIAPAAGFTWRDSQASGENSMRWYRDAVGMEGEPPRQDQRVRLLEYNEDDVRATFTLRGWMSSRAVLEIPFVGDLSPVPS